MSLRVVVVDDEPIARRRVKRLLAAIGSVEVVGEAGDGRAALQCVARVDPHLVFLDVRMPGMDGFDVARELPSPRPFVIFLTAHDQFALQAFEVHAIDYLLKPVSRDRLTSAVEHARARLEEDPAGRDARLADALARLARDRAALRRVPVRSRGRVELLDVSTIDWCEAAGNYVVLHVGRASHMMRETLKHLEQQLPPRMFVRIHRSTIVRLDAIARLETERRGDYGVVLRDGTRLTLSRTHRRRLEEALGRRL